MTLFPSLRRIRSAPVALHRLHSVFACERRLIDQSKGTVQQRARTQNRINLLSFLRPVRSAPVALHRLRTVLKYEGQTRLEGAMSSTPRSMQSDAAQWASGEPTARTTVRPRGSRIEWRPRAREPVLGRALALFVIVFCAGVVATLAWQSDGGAARKTIASTSSRLGWLAPPAAPAAEGVPAVPSPDQEVLKAISLDITGVRQHLDEIAAQLSVDHEQMTRDITSMLESDQEGLKAISLDITGVRQHLDEIAAQLSVDHEQMTRDITRGLEAAEKDVLDKIGSALLPRPTAAPARSAH
jgi:hypothetical protein